MSPIHSWVRNAVFYQIFPDRFCNGDPTNDPGETANWDKEPEHGDFFGGDLEGILKKIDYLKYLGINAIYLNPIFKAPSNHKYDTENYFQVDPHFGTNELLTEVVQELHAEGIRVILDGVFNHCGKSFFAFQDVLHNGRNSKYRDWFVIEDFPVVLSPEPNYACWGGVSDMPEFNTSNPMVQEYLLDVVEYWIRKADIDGWRLDAVEHMDPFFVKKINERAKKVKEEAYIVGEVMSIPASWLKCNCLDAVMNYKLREAVVDFFAFNSLDSREFDSRIRFLRFSCPKEVNHIMFNLLSSHDTPRFLTLCNGNVEKMKLAIVFLTTYVGVPVVYYGDEIGMNGGSDPDCRRGFIWNKSQQNTELVSFWRTMIDLRQKYIPLRYGNFVTVRCFESTYCYARIFNNQMVLVILNNSDKYSHVCINLKEIGVENTLIRDLLSDSEMRLSADKHIDLELPPFGFEIFFT